MIDYELATRLKDAGFPQQWTSENLKYNMYPFYAPIQDGDKIVYEYRTSLDILAAQLDKEDLNYWVYIPTLSELIEACGKKFHDLLRVSDEFMENNKRWKASPITALAYPNDIATRIHSQYGETQEEAVALLWLELNQNNK